MSEFNQTPAKDESGLLPCPFCGGDAIVYKGFDWKKGEHNTILKVGCLTCKANRDTVEQWQQRTASPDAKLVAQKTGRTIGEEEMYTKGWTDGFNSGQKEAAPNTEGVEKINLSDAIDIIHEIFFEGDVVDVVDRMKAKAYK